jgi:chloride channel protein, CIC family
MVEIERFTGGGYETLALTGSLPAKILLALCALKLAATVCSYSSGGAGGIFAPSLFIGGTLGGAIDYLEVAIFHHPPDSIGAFALVGMGAVFAGIIRSPMTSVLIIVEMTGGYALVLPLMIANMSAYALGRHWRHTPIYEALLQEGIVLRTVSPSHPISSGSATGHRRHSPTLVIHPSDNETLLCAL